MYIYRYVFFVDCVDFPPMSSTMAGSDGFQRFVWEDDPHFRAGLAMNLRYLLPAQDYIHWFWWLYDYLYRPLLGLRENTPTNDLQIMGFSIYLCGFVWNGVSPISMVYHPLSPWTCYKWGCYQSIFIGTTYINPFFIGIFFLSWGIFYKDFYISPNIPFP